MTENPGGESPSSAPAAQVITDQPASDARSRSRWWMLVLIASFLAALFSGSTGLVFPSFYEGFGLPVIEAAASGAPVLTSTVSSLPDVAPRDALLVETLGMLVEIGYTADPATCIRSSASDRAGATASPYESCAASSRSWTRRRLPSSTHGEAVVLDASGRSIRQLQ